MRLNASNPTQVDRRGSVHEFFSLKDQKLFSTAGSQRFLFRRSNQRSTLSILVIRQADEGQNSRRVNLG